ncbi:hypothetical protein ATG98_1255 [Marinobacter sp. LV10R520-4]|uniref:hypothetical protein n=1 Tax=Marinobacter sp. LV10R520-4 TaxID=1761796 RepID=UPI000BF8EF53|nr:hypothetical protein [Marinobacter sp. LV10R520-4]PFG52247.1 hypothetical protein ATG98_1255 [Marinobacter sp. LV10R520-4]
MKLICTRAMIVFIALFYMFALPAHAAQKPAWIFEAPQSGPSLQSVGSGNTVAEARQVALGNILLQVSQTLQANTRSIIESHNGVANTQFQQKAQGKSLNLDISQTKIARQWRDPDTSDVYLQIAVAKTDLVRALEDRLAKMAVLRFPDTSSQTDQLLWALKHLESLDLGLRLDRALTALGAGQPDTRAHLAGNQKKAMSIWQTAGVRIIAKQSLDSISNLIRQRLPTSTNTALWLQLNQQTYHRLANGRTEIKKVLSINLKQPHSPFTSYYQREVVALAAGPDRSSAALAAEQALADKLNQPLANWLF